MMKVKKKNRIELKTNREKSLNMSHDTIVRQRWELGVQLLHKEKHKVSQSKNEG